MILIRLLLLFGVAHAEAEAVEDNAKKVKRLILGVADHDDAEEHQEVADHDDAEEHQEDVDNDDTLMMGVDRDQSKKLKKIYTDVTRGEEEMEENVVHQKTLEEMIGDLKGLQKYFRSELGAGIVDEAADWGALTKDVIQWINEDVMEENKFFRWHLLDMAKMQRNARGVVALIDWRFHVLNDMAKFDKVQSMNTIKESTIMMSAANEELQEKVDDMSKRFTNITKHYQWREGNTVKKVMQGFRSRMRGQMRAMKDQYSALRADLSSGDKVGPSKESLLQANGPSPDDWFGAAAFTAVSGLVGGLMEGMSVSSTSHDSTHSAHAAHLAKLMAGVDDTAGMVEEGKSHPYDQENDGPVPLSYLEKLQRSGLVEEDLDVRQFGRDGAQFGGIGKAIGGAFNGIGNWFSDLGKLLFGDGDVKRSAKKIAKKLKPNPDLLWHPDGVPQRPYADRLNSMDAKKYEYGTYDNAIRSDLELLKKKPESDRVNEAWDDARKIRGRSPIQYSLARAGSIKDQKRDAKKEQKEKNGELKSLYGDSKKDFKTLDRLAKSMFKKNVQYLKAIDSKDSVERDGGEVVLEKKVDGLVKHHERNFASFESEIERNFQSQALALSLESSNMKTSISNTERAYKTKIGDDRARVAERSEDVTDKNKQVFISLTAQETAMNDVTTELVSQLGENRADMAAEAEALTSKVHDALNDIYNQQASAKEKLKGMETTAKTGITAELDRVGEAGKVDLARFGQEVDSVSNKLTRSLGEIQKWQRGFASRRADYNGKVKEFNDKQTKTLDAVKKDVEGSLQEATDLDARARTELVELGASSKLELDNAASATVSDQRRAVSAVTQQMRTESSSVEQETAMELSKAGSATDKAQQLADRAKAVANDLMDTTLTAVNKVKDVTLPVVERMEKKNVEAMAEAKKDQESEIEELGDGFKGVKQWDQGKQILGGEIAMQDADQSNAVKGFGARTKADIEEKEGEIESFDKGITRNIDQITGKVNTAKKVLQSLSSIGQGVKKEMTKQFGTVKSGLTPQAMLKVTGDPEDVIKLLGKKAVEFERDYKGMLKHVSTEQQKEYDTEMKERQKEITQILADAQKAADAKEAELKYLDENIGVELNNLNMTESITDTRLQKASDQEHLLREKVMKALKQESGVMTTTDALLSSSASANKEHLDNKATEMANRIIGKADGLTDEMAAEVLAVSKGAAAEMAAIAADETKSDEEKALALKKLDQKTKDKIEELTGITLGAEEGLLGLEKIESADGMLIQASDKQLAHLLHHEAAARMQMLASDKRKIANDAVALDKYVGNVLESLQRLVEMDGVELTDDLKAGIAKMTKMKVRTAAVAELRLEDARKTALLADKLKFKAENMKNMTEEELEALNAEINGMVAEVKKGSDQIRSKMHDLDKLREAALGASRTFAVSGVHKGMEVSEGVGDVIARVAKKSGEGQQKLEKNEKSFRHQIDDFIQETVKTEQKRLGEDHAAQNSEDALIFKDGQWVKKFAKEMNASETAAKSELDEMRDELDGAIKETGEERDAAVKRTMAQFYAAQKGIDDRAEGAASEAKNIVANVVHSGSVWMSKTSAEVFNKAQEEDLLAKQVAEDAEARAKKFDEDDDHAVAAMKGVQKDVSDMTLGMDHIVENIERQTRNREAGIERERMRALKELEDMNKRAKTLGGGSLAEIKESRGMRLEAKLANEEKETSEIDRQNDENQKFLDSLLENVAKLA